MTKTATLPPFARELKAMLLGCLACGTLDITAAFIAYGILGVKPLVLLHFIASGALGARSFQGGLATAALGLFFEYLISLGAAAAYVIASRFLPILLNRAEICGVLYGVFVYFFMNGIVVPLSATSKQPFSLKLTIIGIVIHMFCVGLPIALVARHVLGRPRLLAPAKL
jgi:uncharacterized membrane protein YagU involved in acid resistance